MKSVFICALMLALAQYSLAYNNCGIDITYNSTIQVPCSGNDVGILWPNYEISTKYYKCVGFGQLDERTCPQGLYFAYVYQKCVNCDKMIPPPNCEYLAQSTDVTCVTITTPSPTTLTTPTTASTKPSTTPSATKSTEASTNSTTPSIPSVTPPTQSTSDPEGPPSQPPSLPTGPTPPLEVTVAPGIPTPSIQPPTPPSMNNNPPTVAI